MLGNIDHVRVFIGSLGFVHGSCDFPQKLAVCVELVVGVADFLHTGEKSAQMTFFVAACVIFAAADCEPACDHVAGGIEIVPSAADLLESCCSGTPGRGGKTEVVVIAADLYNTGQDLTLALFALYIAGIVFFAADCKEAELHIPLGVKIIQSAVLRYKSGFILAV